MLQISGLRHLDYESRVPPIVNQIVFRGVFCDADLILGETYTRILAHHCASYIQDIMHAGYDQFCATYFEASRN